MTSSHATCTKLCETESGCEAMCDLELCLEVCAPEDFDALVVSHHVVGDEDNTEEEVERGRKRKLKNLILQN